MPNFNADVQAALAATPPVRAKVNKLHGRLRFLESTFVTPAAGLVIGDTRTWGPLPRGARVIGHLSQLRFGTGTASATLTLGDAASAARHLAATSIASAGVAVPEAAAANGA